MDNLTIEELNKVNKIISDIQTDITYAVEKLKSGDYDTAIKHIVSGQTRSNCPLCKKELGILIADITHNKSICILGSDKCQEEKNTLIKKAVSLRDEFVPITSTKKAIRDKNKKTETITSDSITDITKTIDKLIKSISKTF